MMRNFFGSEGRTALPIRSPSTLLRTKEGMRSPKPFDATKGKLIGRLEPVLLARSTYF